MSIVEPAINTKADKDENNGTISANVDTNVWISLRIFSALTTGTCELFILLLLQIYFRQAIDFGNLDLNREIDFGEEVDLETAEGDIDWGDESTEQPIAEEIDYDISLEESGIVVETVGHEGGVAAGCEAYTILDNPATRVEFINQLFEVQQTRMILHNLDAPTFSFE